MQFEITEQTRESLEVWIKAAGLLPSDSCFRAELRRSPHPARSLTIYEASLSK